MQQLQSLAAARQTPGDSFCAVPQLSQRCQSAASAQSHSCPKDAILLLLKSHSCPKDAILLLLNSPTAVTLPKMPVCCLWIQNSPTAVPKMPVCWMQRFTVCMDMLTFSGVWCKNIVTVSVTKQRLKGPRYCYSLQTISISYIPLELNSTTTSNKHVFLGESGMPWEFFSFFFECILHSNNLS